ncbi:MAG: sulfurtransferase TusA family protein [Alphaproteobacteria bacterium]|nr:sulfurtransferase TusA family protein [Alphaproteobacteria bacterium]
MRPHKTLPQWSSTIPTTANASAGVTLDLRGYLCPVPVIRLEAALRLTASGEQVIVFTDDPIAVVDIPHFCCEAGHAVSRLPDSGDACVFQVTRCAKPLPE